MSLDCCATCRYWFGNRETGRQGQCRRYPPFAAGIMIGQQATVANPTGQPVPIPVYSLPDTTPEHWCGDFAPEMVS